MCWPKIGKSSNEPYRVGNVVALVAGRQVNPYLLSALISSGIAFFCGWSANDWRHDAHEKQAIAQAAADQRELHRMEQARSRAALDAQVVARKQEARLRADAAASQSELDSLRAQSSSALRTAASSLAACTAISATYGELLLDSERRYQELAVKADEHVIDLRVQISTP